MLTDEEIINIKQEYINLLRQIKRPNCDIDGFIAYLESTDFFNAPASTQYHCSFPGGLVLHTLNVYDTLKSLNESLEHRRWREDTILIVSLLHDLDKILKYEKTSKNEKEYCSDGDKSDSIGKFRWKTTETYRVKDSSSKVNLGNKGFAAYMIASMFFSLSAEETYAIMYQYSAISSEQLTDLSAILSRYPLCVLLHSADIIATYIVETNNE